jgi:hypothetical protein
MTYAQSLEKYYKNGLFQVGFILMIATFFLYQIVSSGIINVPISQMGYWINISTLVLIVCLIGAVIGAYALYQVSRQIKPEKRGTKH